MSTARHLKPRNIFEVLRKNLYWKPGVLKPPTQQSVRYEAERIAICVSGGPDSMALAYLLHHMTHPHDPNVNVFESHGFIVDHEMRAESTVEALKVKQNLEALGINSSIITAGTGNDCGSSKELTAFKSNKNETTARAFRYQAIIAAALKNGIDKLFLGHHHDDQMETLLMKMIMQRSMNLSSFQGMQFISSAPHSVQNFNFRWSWSESNGPTHASNSNGTITSQRHRTTKLVRPLLEFPKARLVATCEHHGIPYVSDKTNSNPTYTLRNAIRYLRSYIRLPRALQDGAMTRLRERAVESTRSEEAAAKDFMRMVTAKKEYAESGMVQLALATAPTNENEYNTRGAGFALARLCDLISPIDKDLLPSRLSQSTTDSILALMRNHGPKNSEPAEADGLHQQILKVDFRSPLRDSIAHDNNPYTLQMSRQPMRKSEILANTYLIKPQISADGEVTYSEWINWDNRFWIRAQWKDSKVENLCDLILRPYQPQDVADVRKLLAGTENPTCTKYTYFEQHLHTCAPGHVRYTMPVFALNGTVVAFPTCHFQLVKSIPFSWETTVHHPHRAIAFFDSQG